MRNFKGIYTDCDPINQPEGTYRNANNMRITENAGTVESDSPFSEIITNFSVNRGVEIGRIAFDNSNIVFFTDNNGNDSIAVFDNLTDTWSVKIDREDLGFNTDYPITGTAKRNANGQIIVAFTDNNQQPFLANLDTIVTPFNKDTILMFPAADVPHESNNFLLNQNIQVTENDTGGEIKSGSYSFIVKYEDKDNSESRVLTITNPYQISSFVANPDNSNYNTYIGSPINTNTSKSFTITVSNIDLDYKNIVLYVIKSVNNTISAAKITTQPIGSSSQTYIYTGVEEETVDIIDLLTETGEYQKVVDITSLNTELKLAGLSNEDEIELQTIANNTTINWIATLETINSLPDRVLNETNEKRNSPKRASSNNAAGFMPDEVYAMYISFITKTGRRTTAFHIPGAMLIADEKATTATSNIPLFDTSQTPINSLSPATNYGATIATRPAFEICDTSYEISQISTNIKRGAMGKWENQTEFYPSTFPNFAGQKIRHHKFPSLKRLRGIFTGVNTSKNQFPKLGIQAIPDFTSMPKFFDKYQGYEIYYAQRTNENATIAGQGLTQINNYQDGGSVDTYISSGGNFATTLIGNLAITTNFKYFRTVAPEMINNDIQIETGYISNEIVYRTDNTSFNTAVVGDTAGANVGKSIGLDFWQTSGSFNVCRKEDQLIEFDNGRLVATGGSGTYKNTFLEKAHFFRNTLSRSNYVIQSGQINYDIATNTFLKPNADQNRESSIWLSNYKRFRDDVYKKFDEQTLVCTNVRRIFQDQNDFNNDKTALGFGGDTFNCDFSHVQIGRVNSDDPSFGGYLPTDQSAPVKIVYRYTLQSRINYNLRHEGITTNSQAAAIYPNTAVNSSSFFTFAVTNQPNNGQFIDPSLFPQNTYRQLTIFNPFNEFSNEFPLRIHTSIPKGQEDKFENWKFFRPLDYYELKPGRGVITGIGTIDDDLVIWTEQSVFKTRDKTEFETDGIKAILGSGDIFQFEPKEFTLGEYGYAGLQNRIGKYNSPLGWVWVDANQGKVFKIGEQLEELSNTGRRNFFRDNIQKSYLDSQFFNNSDRYGYYFGWDEFNKRLFLTVRNTTGVFTSSYTPYTKSWVSMHSDYDGGGMYLPKRDKLYITANGTVYAKSDSFNECSIDVILNDSNTVTKLLQSFQFMSDFKVNGVSQYNKTFNRFRISTNHQDSGEIIVPDEINFSIADTKLKRIRENEWSFNSFRDLLLNNVITNNLPWFKQKRFIDKWFRVQLKAISNTPQSSLSLYNVEGNYTPIDR